MSNYNFNTKDISGQVITMDKEYVTRNGKKVKVFTNTRNNKYSVVSLVDNSTLETHLPNGSIFEGKQYYHDIIEVQNVEEGIKKYDLVMVAYKISGGYSDFTLRFFSHYEDGKAFAFINGKFGGSTTDWEYCRKATPEEIVANKDDLD